VVDAQPLQHRGREHARRKGAAEDGLELAVEPADAEGLEVELALLEQGGGGDALLARDADGARVGVGEDEGRGATGRDGRAGHLAVLRRLLLSRLLLLPPAPVLRAGSTVGRERPHRQPQVDPLQLEHHLLPGRQHLARKVLKQARRQLLRGHLARLAVGRLGHRGDLGVDDGGHGQGGRGEVGMHGHGVAGRHAQDAALDRVERNASRGDGGVGPDVEDAFLFLFGVVCCVCALR
jgi:hypothetical protein